MFADLMTGQSYICKFGYCAFEFDWEVNPCESAHVSLYNLRAVPVAVHCVARCELVVEYRLQILQVEIPPVDYLTEIDIRVQVSHKTLISLQ
jgi:hypothetical protein